MIVQTYNNNSDKQTFDRYNMQEVEKIKELCSRNNLLFLRKTTYGDEFANWDCSIMSGNSTVLIVEVKVRSFHYQKYHSAILTQKKITSIRNDIQQMNKFAIPIGITLIPFYIAFYSNATLGWEMKNETIGTLPCPHNSASDGRHNIRQKVVAHFKIKDAIYL